MAVVPRIRLFQYPGLDGFPSISPPCAKVQLALRIMGLGYEVVDIDSPFAAKRVSPTGRLPSIDIDGTHRCDSVAILDLLAERFPDRALGPKDALGRVRDRLWDTFVTDTLYWLTYYLRWCIPANSRKACERIARDRWFIGRVVMPLYVVPGMRKRAKMQAVGGRPAAEVMADLERALDALETGLQGGPFLEGRAAPGRGDLALAAQLMAVAYAGGIPEALHAIRQRPGVQELPGRAFAAAGIALPTFWPGG